MSLHYDLAGRRYDEHPTLVLKDALKAGYGSKHAENNITKEGYVKDKQLSNHNQQVYYNKEKNHMLYNVSGTHNLSDWGTDLYLGLGKLKNTNRYKSAKKTLEKAKGKYQTDNVDVTGHSLGGAIAQYVGSKKDRVTTYNKGATIGQKTRNNETAYRTKNDPVSFFSSSKNMKTISQTKFDPHSTDNLTNTEI
jgi:hypothetical protein